MKVKQYLYITNPEAFADDPKKACYVFHDEVGLGTREHTKGWLLVDEMELDVTKHINALIRSLEIKQQKLLAITHGGEE